MVRAVQVVATSSLSCCRMGCADSAQKECEAMPMESEAYVLLVEVTSPRKCAVYVIPVSKEECERLRKRGIKKELEAHE